VSREGEVTTGAGEESDLDVKVDASMDVKEADAPGGASDERASREGGRHRGREVALQVLYAIDLAVDEDLPRRELQEQIFERIVENFDVPRAAEQFARELVTGVAARVDALDVILGAHARNWRVSRMAAVDRNVLRLAVFELGDSDIPVAVVIDEAVDLARRFGADSSPAFVNGVLDAAAREVRAA
jgi:N utilization substance protein B